MNDELSMILIDIQDDNYLEHHGIMGQKWGDQNGPPYPLGSGQLSGRERRLNPDGSNEQQKAEGVGSKITSTIRKISEDRAAKKAELEKQRKKEEIEKKRQKTIEAKKKAEEAKAKAEKERQEKLHSLTANQLLEHRLEYTHEEIENAMLELMQANNLADVAISEARKQNDLFDQEVRKSEIENKEWKANIDKANRGADVIGVAINYGEKAIGLYNVFATLSGNPKLEQRAQAKLDKMKSEVNNAKKDGKSLVTSKDPLLRAMAKDLEGDGKLNVFNKNLLAIKYGGEGTDEYGEAVKTIKRIHENKDLLGEIGDDLNDDSAKNKKAAAAKSTEEATAKLKRENAYRDEQSKADAAAKAETRSRNMAKYTSQFAEAYLNPKVRDPKVTNPKDPKYWVDADPSSMSADEYRAAQNRTLSRAVTAAYNDVSTAGSAGDDKVVSDALKEVSNLIKEKK